MAATRKRGRPLELHRVVIPETDERPAVTVADQMIAAVRAGNPISVAAEYAGVGRTTLLEYLRIGARTLIAKAANPTLTEHDFTPKENACAEFSDRVTRAQAEFEVQTHQIVDRVIRGGIEQTTVTVEHGLREVPQKDAHGRPVLDRDGNPVMVERMVETKRTVKTTESMPDAMIGLRRLQMRHPERYAVNRHLHAATTPDMLEQPLSEADAAALLLDSLHEYEPIEAESTEIIDGQ